MSKILRIFELCPKCGAATRVDMTWEEVHNEQKQLKEDYRRINDARTDDKAYLDYCAALDEFLDAVPLDDIDGQYRIAEARRRRAKGISPWK